MLYLTSSIYIMIAHIHVFGPQFHEHKVQLRNKRILPAPWTTNYMLFYTNETIIN